MQEDTWRPSWRPVQECERETTWRRACTDAQACGTCMSVREAARCVVDYLPDRYEPSADKADQMTRLGWKVTSARRAASSC